MQSNYLPGFDFYKLEDRLTEQQRAMRDRVRDYVETTVTPNITPYWEAAEFPWELIRPIADLGILGGMVRGHGSAGLDPLEMGLAMYELAKGDGSISTFYGVQSSLAMGSIGLLGSDEQHERWLPGLAKLDLIGAFGLTEPEVGSNAAGIHTTARRDGDSYVLNGAKRWIGNASISDVLIVWARDDDGRLGAFVVEGVKDGVEGLAAENIPYKIGKRAIMNGHLTLENVRTPVDNRLPGVSSFRDASKMLTLGRTSVAWEAAGAGTGAFEVALKYTMEREQFGQPIAGFQLMQQKLVEMATEVTAIAVDVLPPCRANRIQSTGRGHCIYGKVSQRKKGTECGIAGT